MSTPIEIVREYLRESEGRDLIVISQDFPTALAAVLRDAERYKALERAHDSHRVKQGWCEYIPDEWTKGWQLNGVSLAELADKLRSETK